MGALLSNGSKANMAIDARRSEPMIQTLFRMAHLLGSQACIDSLRVDVEDLQAVVHEIVGKTGSIK